MDAEKKKSRLWVWIVAAAAVLAAAAGFYAYRANYYRTHFFPGVTVNGIDCGGLSIEQAEGRLNSRSVEYTLEVMGRDPEHPEENAVLGTIAASDIDMRYEDAGMELSGLLTLQNGWAWPRYYLGGADQSFDLTIGVFFDESLLSECVYGWDALQIDRMSEAEDAYIAAGADGEETYHIEPGARGTVCDPESVYNAILTAVRSNQTSVDIDGQGLYEDSGLSPEDSALQAALATLNRWLRTEITYNWNGHEVRVDGGVVEEWIDYSEDSAEPALNEEAIAEFVAERAGEYDTFGRKMDFTTCEGEIVTLSRSGYGWKVDREAETEALKELIMEGSVTEREPEYVYRAFYGGEDDIGDSFVEINLTEQHLYLHVEGEVILESDLVSGNVSRGNTTPPGIFGITYKTRDAVLRGATYESNVSYWMPFNGNIGMHDATWRKKFGGKIYMTNGSHGCVNLPFKAAKEIYEYVSKGFPVVCYYTDGIPTASGAQTAAAEEVVPTGGETLPTGGETLPTGGEALPTGGETLPTGGEVVPTGGEVVSTGGEALPTGGEVLPTGGEVVPTGGEALPTGEEALLNGTP